jgi:hypothetical protein
LFWIQRQAFAFALILYEQSAAKRLFALENHICYIYPMSDVRINKSALRHGISETDIRLTLINFIYEAPIAGEADKFLAVGFDERGNLIEVIYEYVDDDAIHVFHAMKCRKAILELFER